ncbi:MAG: hypothetical protein NC395_02880, partial [Prevotella sp.]|nr:hypothetical protein [Prevotella sp.]
CKFYINNMNKKQTPQTQFAKEFAEFLAVFGQEKEFPENNKKKLPYFYRSFSGCGDTPLAGVQGFEPR